MDDFTNDEHISGGDTLPVSSAQVGLRPLWTPDPGTQLTVIRDLGQALEAHGTINAAQRATAKGLAEKNPGKPLADIFFEMGIDEAELQQTVASIAQVAFERIDPQQLEAAKFINRLTLAYCEEHGVMPLRYAGSRLLMGMVHVDDLVLLDELRHKTGQSIKPVVVTRGDIAAVVETLKVDESEDASVSMDEVLEGIDEDDVEVVEDANEDLDLEKMAGESPVIRYVNYLIFNAVKEGASDIHIEPQEKKLRVRYRIDGVMFDATSPPNNMRSAIISRIKIMANLDIAERRLPQDGRIRAMVHGRKLDLRVSTLPMVQGEKCVMRILDTRSIQVDLDDLGMDQDSLQIWKHQIDQPHGIVLVTGPTGSGKSDHALLRHFPPSTKPTRSTSPPIEDPIEYHLQRELQPDGQSRRPDRRDVRRRRCGHILRQDPDVIMVGEIRDVETAKTAIEASLTGHLVLSTLHTNDAPSAITRLINIGVEPYLIGSAVNGVLAQRLVRKICPECKTQVPPNETVAEHLAMQGIALDEVWEGTGCDKCRGTGYSGRLGIYEMLVLNDGLRDRVAGNPNVTEFRRMCVEGGMVTLRQDGFRKVQAGLTTVDEVLRVTES